MNVGKWIINGSKTFITNANTDLTLGITVQCITGASSNGRKEISAILLERDTLGFSANTMHGKLMWRASNTAELFFDNCTVPESKLLGKRGNGAKIMLNTLDSGRLSIAAMGLGCAQGAYELACAYSKKRNQFIYILYCFDVTFDVII